MSLRLGMWGFGVVGSALGTWIVANTKHAVLVRDPGRNMDGDMSGINAAFISVPVATDKDGDQDLSILRSCVDQVPAGVPIFVRSTVLPGTCRRLSIKRGGPVYAMPEFLTERRAYEDMCNLPVICGGGRELLLDVFEGQKNVFEMLNEEAELAKYTHNCFGAVKINFFNTIKVIADSMGADYQSVLRGAMITGFIEPEHTKVPGPDGKYGFGGKCLPKDLKAFARYASQFSSLSAVVKENDEFRDQTAERFAWATHVGEA